MLLVGLPFFFNVFFFLLRNFLWKTFCLFVCVFLCITLSSLHPWHLGSTLNELFHPNTLFCALYFNGCAYHLKHEPQSYFLHFLPLTSPSLTIHYQEFHYVVLLFKEFQRLPINHRGNVQTSSAPRHSYLPPTSPQHASTGLVLLFPNSSF